MSQTPTTERLDPRVRRTRQLLLQAFQELAQERVPGSLTVREITERATINRATFYAHFRDLDDFLGFVVDETFQKTLDAQLPADPGFSWVNLKGLGLATYEFLSRINGNCPPGEVRRKSRIEAQVQRQVYRVLLDWLNAVTLPPNGRSVDPRLKATALSWAIYGVAMDRDRLIPEQSIGEALDQLLSWFGDV